MTDQTIAEIAAKLTAAQREAIARFPAAIEATPALSVYPDMRSEHYLPFMLAVPCLVGETADEKLECLTPTGLAVRAYLQEQDG